MASVVDREGMRIGFLASGGGSNLQAILDACADGRLPAVPAVMIGNNSQARCVERATAAGVPTVHISSLTHPDDAERDRATLAALQSHGATIVCLSGYMKHLGSRTVAAYRSRIINGHPALLPDFGGKGMYGQRVHEAVLRSGATESGASVHLVDEIYDHGPVIAQTRVPVLADDDVETLAARVLVAEHRLYVDTLRRIATGGIILPARGEVSDATRNDIR
jgi:phosphoribosylglycinamide formyltransferase-1